MQSESLPLCRRYSGSGDWSPGAGPETQTERQKPTGRGRGGGASPVFPLSFKQRPGPKARQKRAPLLFPEISGSSPWETNTVTCEAPRRKAIWLCCCQWHRDASLDGEWAGGGVLQLTPKYTPVDFLATHPAVVTVLALTVSCFEQPSLLPKRKRAIAPLGCWSQVCTGEVQASFDCGMEGHQIPFGTSRKSHETSEEKRRLMQRKELSLPLSVSLSHVWTSFAFEDNAVRDSQLWATLSSVAIIIGPTDRRNVFVLLSSGGSQNQTCPALFSFSPTRLFLSPLQQLTLRETCSYVSEHFPNL